jgi:hypothetical protein
MIIIIAYNKMIKVYVPSSEYVNVLANNISSWCASSRGTIFTWRADIEKCKVSDIPSRNPDTKNNCNNKCIRDNSVDIATNYWLDCWGPIPGRDKDPDRLWGLPILLSDAYGMLFHGIKGAEVRNLPLTSIYCPCQEWFGYTSTHTYVFMAWCLIN